MIRPLWLDNSLAFPDTSLALEDPNGLLAVGGDLSPERLLCAYQQGIFPWFTDDQPILWWSPSPRMALIPDELHIGRSAKKLTRKRLFSLRVDTAFSAVVEQCSKIPRHGQDGSWITQEMSAAYNTLYSQGYAHSVEAWKEGRLVGGLYGVAIGRAFFGESMFSLASGASRVCFITLAKQLQAWNYEIVDCQIHTDYLESFGAKEMSRGEFEIRLQGAVNTKGVENWRHAWTQPEFGID